MFLLPEHEECAKELIDQEILFLQSKHVLVSASLKSMVKELLDEKPQGAGREAFLKRRSGVVEIEKCYTLPEESKTFRPLLQTLAGYERRFAFRTCA